MDRFQVAALAAVTLCCAAAFPAAAQSQLPDTVRPGQVEREFEQPPEPRSVPGRVAFPAADAPVPANADEIRFVLSKLELAGVTAYDPAVLAALYSPSPGTRVSLADVYATAQKITRRYRSDGYLISRALIPAQEVEDGVVHIQVLEGFLDNVRIDGDIARESSLVRAYTDKLTEARPLRVEELERYLLLINDLPGLNAAATLAPSAGPGASELLLGTSHQSIEGLASVENRGSRFLGPYRGEVAADLNSIWGRISHTKLGFTTTLADDELRFLQGSHEEFIGAEGLKLSLAGSTVRSEPGLEELGSFTGIGRLVTRSVEASATLTYPLIRSREQNLSLRSSFTFHNNKTRLEGVAPSKDRIRALRVGGTWDAVDRYRGVSIVDIALSQGLNILGATSSKYDNRSRAGGKSDFTKLSVYVARLQALEGGFSLLVAANGQYAFNELLSPEGFGFGGAQFGRAYDASELFGDSGVALKLELRFTGGAVPAPQFLGFASDSVPFVTGYTAYLFTDSGYTWRRNPQVGEAHDDSAIAAGLGLRFDLIHGVSGYVELAQPVTRDVAAERSRNPRAFFALSVSY